jgi:hypothetical protein
LKLRFHLQLLEKISKALKKVDTHEDNVGMQSLSKKLTTPIAELFTPIMVIKDWLLRSNFIIN